MGMKILFCSFLKTKESFLQHLGLRRIWKSARMMFSVSSETPEVDHVVFVSTSTDIYQNLALENWLHEKGDLENRNYLLMWKNTPAVVIGRHQNPWEECDVQSVLQQDVHLVRRKSGGGTVYHDEGNLNCSFIMARSRYNRKANLELVIKALQSRWDVDLSVNQKEDIVLNGMYKVSGTASKIGAERTTHHFTLVFDVNKDSLHNLLRSPLKGVDSKATQSIPSQVMNLRDVASSIDFHSLVDVIGKQFLRQSPQGTSLIKNVDPGIEENFPGIAKLSDDLKTWDWIFGKTPKFSISRCFSTYINNEKLSLCVCSKINKGCVEDARIYTERSNETPREHILHWKTLDQLKGVKFHHDELTCAFENVFHGYISEAKGERNAAKYDWILSCLKECLMAKK